ncbi:MAG: hypothetical protein Q9183_002764, partial [Haloplaca sp. 2 TL-2023]
MSSSAPLPSQARHAHHLSRFHKRATYSQTVRPRLFVQRNILFVPRNIMPNPSSINILKPDLEMKDVDLEVNDGGDGLNIPEAHDKTIPNPDLKVKTVDLEVNYSSDVGGLQEERLHHNLFLYSQHGQAGRLPKCASLPYLSTRTVPSSLK